MLLKMITLPSIANGRMTSTLSAHPTRSAHSTLAARHAMTYLKITERGMENGTLAARDQFPDFVRNPSVGQVREESGDVAGRHSAEKIANHISDRGTPRGCRAEQERAHDWNRVGGTQFGDAGNQRHDLERHQHRGVQRGRNRAQHDHPRVAPHQAKIAHRGNAHARRDACAAHACDTKEMIDSHVHLDADQYPDPSAQSSGRRMRG